MTLFASCDPDNKDIFNLESVKLNGIINNTNSQINVKDTLKVVVQLPDIIINSSGTYKVNSIQKANFYIRILKVDTINKRAIKVDPPAYWTTQGTISQTNSYDFDSNKNSKPYSVIINFKPQEKGIYYFEVVPQAGQLKINDSYEARLYVNFNVADKHINLAAAYFGGQVWTDEANNKDLQGFGVYVFRVI